jgi:hypothetical protein
MAPALVNRLLITTGHFQPGVAGGRRSRLRETERTGTLKYQNRACAILERHAV